MYSRLRNYLWKIMLSINDGTIPPIPRVLTTLLIQSRVDSHLLYSSPSLPLPPLPLHWVFLCDRFAKWCSVTQRTGQTGQDSFYISIGKLALAQNHHAVKEAQVTWRGHLSVFWLEAPAQIPAKSRYVRKPLRWLQLPPPSDGIGVRDPGQELLAETTFPAKQWEIKNTWLLSFSITKFFMRFISIDKENAIPKNGGWGKAKSKFLPFKRKINLQ